ncbi:MAG TPA: hypothetical protein VGQ55_13105 [Pyrinomonadaceae bacterium]|nr:hypothetical protein [Pyrinomonadaceae bacterium]
MKQVYNIEHHKIAILPDLAPYPPNPHWAPVQERIEEISIAADVPLFDGPGPTASQVNQQDEKDAIEE